jgi:nucleotide-binding universal stress UspA family protein
MSTEARPPDWHEPVVLPEVTAPRRILVAFDGSHNAERALAWAAYVGARTEIETVVAVAYEQPMTMRGRGAAYIEEARAQLELEATELATEAVDLLHRHELTARGIVVKGDVAHSLLDMAETEGCDLIVIGRQGITSEVGGVAGAVGRVRDMLEGGVTAKVARHARVPVLVVP